MPLSVTPVKGGRSVGLVGTVNILRIIKGLVCLASGVPCSEKLAIDSSMLQPLLIMIAAPCLRFLDSFACSRYITYRTEKTMGKRPSFNLNQLFGTGA